MWGADNNTRLLFKAFIVITIYPSRWVHIYPLQGSIQHNISDSRCVSTIMTLHLLSMKATLQTARAQGQPRLYYPKRGKPPSNQRAPQATLSSQTTLQATRSGQTNTTGGKLVRRYNTPSSTKVLPKRSAGQNPPDIRKAPNHPSPSLSTKVAPLRKTTRETT